MQLFLSLCTPAEKERRGKANQIPGGFPDGAWNELHIGFGEPALLALHLPKPPHVLLLQHGDHVVLVEVQVVVLLGSPGIQSLGLQPFHFFTLQEKKRGVSLLHLQQESCLRNYILRLLRQQQIQTVSTKAAVKLPNNSRNVYIHITEMSSCISVCLHIISASRLNELFLLKMYM